MKYFLLASQLNTIVRRETDLKSFLQLYRFLGNEVEHWAAAIASCPRSHRQERYERKLVSLALIALHQAHPDIKQGIIKRLRKGEDFPMTINSEQYA